LVSETDVAKRAVSGQKSKRSVHSGAPPSAVGRVETSPDASPLHRRCPHVVVAVIVNVQRLLPLVWTVPLYAIILQDGWLQFNVPFQNKYGYIRYDYFTGQVGQPALADTPSEELEDFVEARFYCLHALADGK